VKRVQQSQKLVRDEEERLRLALLRGQKDVQMPSIDILYGKGEDGTTRPMQTVLRGGIETVSAANANARSRAGLEGLFGTSFDRFNAGRGPDQMVSFDNFVNALYSGAGSLGSAARASVGKVMDLDKVLQESRALYKVW